MTVPDSYRVWAPADSPWSPWVKPVLFATLHDFSIGDVGLDDHSARVRLLSGDELDTFVIVDEPGATAVSIGIALAHRGFRPIPLFNGTDGSPALVPVDKIVKALLAGAEELAKIPLVSNAPPAFLLDSNRMTGSAAPRVFDNRWVVVPEDFPSANRLLAARHHKAVILGDAIGSDLAHVLTRYARGGITLLGQDADGAFSKHEPIRPSYFGTLFARMMVLAGRRRSSAGGFGSIVPEPSEGGYG